MNVSPARPESPEDVGQASSFTAINSSPSAKGLLDANVKAVLASHATPERRESGQLPAGATATTNMSNGRSKSSQEASIQASDNSPVRAKSFHETSTDRFNCTSTEFEPWEKASLKAVKQSFAGPESTKVDCKLKDVNTMIAPKLHLESKSNEGQKPLVIAEETFDFPNYFSDADEDTSPSMKEVQAVQAKTLGSLGSSGHGASIKGPGSRPFIDQQLTDTTMDISPTGRATQDRSTLKRSLPDEGPIPKGSSAKRRRKQKPQEGDVERAIKPRQRRAPMPVQKTSQQLPYVGHVRGYDSAMVFPMIYSNGTMHLKVSKACHEDLKAKGYDGVTQRHQINKGRVNFKPELNLTATTSDDKVRKNVLEWLQEKDLIEMILPPAAEAQQETTDYTRSSFRKESTTTSLSSVAWNLEIDNDSVFSPPQTGDSEQEDASSPNSEQQSPNNDPSGATDQDHGLIDIIQAHWNLTDEEFGEQLGLGEEASNSSLIILAAMAKHMDLNNGLAIVKRCRDLGETLLSNAAHGKIGPLTSTELVSIFNHLREKFTDERIGTHPSPEVWDRVAHEAVDITERRERQRIALQDNPESASKVETAGSQPEQLKSVIDAQTIPHAGAQRLGSSMQANLLQVADDDKSFQAVESQHQGAGSRIKNLRKERDELHTEVEDLKSRLQGLEDINHRLAIEIDEGKADMESLESKVQQSRAEACDKDTETHALQEDIKSMRQRAHQQDQELRFSQQNELTLQQNVRTLREQLEASKSKSTGPLEVPAFKPHKRIIEKQEYQVIPSGPNAGKLVCDDFQILEHEGQKYIERTVLCELKLDMGPVDKTPVFLAGNCYYRVAEGPNAGRLVRSLNNEGSLFMPDGLGGDTYVRWTYLEQPPRPEL